MTFFWYIFFCKKYTAPDLCPFSKDRFTAFKKKRPIRRMQVSTLTVKPDHVQVSLTENLLSFYDIVFVFSCLSAVLFQWSSFADCLMRGSFGEATLVVYTFVIANPYFCFLRLLHLCAFCSFFIVSRVCFPVFFTGLYIFTCVTIGVCFIFTVRYHTSVGNYKDASVFLFFRRNLNYFILFVTCAQYCAFFHSDYQCVAMGQFVCVLYFQFITQDVVANAIAFNDGQILPGDMQRVMAFGALAQSAALTYAPIILICPSSFLSSFFIKLCLLDLAYNTQQLRDAVMRMGNIWWAEPHLVPHYQVVVCSFFRVDPDLYNLPSLLGGFLDRAPNHVLINRVIDLFRADVFEEVFRRNVTDRLVKAIGMRNTLRVFSLDNFVLAAGDDQWFAPTLVAMELCPTELLVLLEHKDPDLLCVRDLIQRRFPVRDEFDLDDLDAGHLISVALRRATLPEVLALLTQKYIDDPSRISDSECTAFFVEFMQYMSYDVRSTILWSFPYGDPAVSEILKVRFRNLDPISAQMFMREFLGFVLHYHPEWSGIPLGSFQGLWLVEDQRSEAVAVRVADGETE